MKSKPATTFEWKVRRFFETSISVDAFLKKKKTADKALQYDTVFCVEQGFTVEDEMDEYVVPSGDSN